MVERLIVEDEGQVVTLTLLCLFVGLKMEARNVFLERHLAQMRSEVEENSGKVARVVEIR